MYDRHLTITDEILKELDTTNENGFRPVIIGTLRNFLPDYLEDESDEDVVELYERKVAQELERQYHDLLNYNYMSKQIQTANEKLTDAIIREMRKKSTDELLAYNPYRDKYLLYLVRCNRDFINSAILFDLDGADDWEDGPKKKLEVAYLIREACDSLALGLIGFPEYLFRAAGNTRKTDVIIDFPSNEKSDSPYYRRLTRRLDPSLYAMPVDTWWWRRVPPQDKNIMEERFNSLSLSTWIYERRLEFMKTFISNNSLDEDNAIIKLINTPCSHDADKGEISEFKEGQYPSDFEDKFAEELIHNVKLLSLVSDCEPLESREIGELEYIAYLLAGDEDKAVNILKDKTGKTQLSRRGVVNVEKR